MPYKNILTILLVIFFSLTLVSCGNKTDKFLDKYENFIEKWATKVKASPDGKLSTEDMKQVQQEMKELNTEFEKDIKQQMNEKQKQRMVELTKRLFSGK